MGPCGAQLADLPRDLLEAVVQYLVPRDEAALACVCRQLDASLRLDSVAAGASPMLLHRWGRRERSGPHPGGSRHRLRRLNAVSANFAEWPLRLGEAQHAWLAAGVSDGDEEDVQVPGFELLQLSATPQELAATAGSEGFCSAALSRPVREERGARGGS